MVRSRRWWWLDAPSAEEDAAYWAEQRLAGDRSWRFLFTLVVVCNLLWWPSDRFVFDDSPLVREHMTWIRGVSIILFGTGAIVSLVRPLQRYASVMLVSVVLIECVFLGYQFGLLGGPDTQWFYVLIPVVVPPAIIPYQLRERVLVPSLIALMSVFGFFGLHPEHRHQPGTWMALGFLTFMVLVSIAGGLLTEYWRRQAFFLRRATDRQAQELALLNSTLASRVAEQTSELRLLTSHLESARESERAHISRELHDELGQELTAVRYALKFTRLRYEREPLAISGNLDDIERTLGNVTTRMRGIVRELRPKALDDLGLFAAAEWLVKSFEQRTGVVCELTAPPNDPPIDKEAATAVYRILQEALTNVARHAHAGRVVVTLEMQEGELRLSVRDDGIGFNVGRPSSGTGLLGMRERARALGGSLDVESREEGGTLVAAHLPDVLRSMETTA
jgi:signal transduction histidine kinase